MTCLYVTEQKRPLYKNVIHMLSPIKTVYAAENEEDKAKTSIEKLGQHQPVVLVSDEEVREYLSKESGKDRLWALFNKGFV